MVSNKKIHRALRNHKTYEQYPLEKFLIFTIYQNYTSALIKNSYLATFWWFCDAESQLWLSYMVRILQRTKLGAFVQDKNKLCKLQHNSNWQKCELQ